jgi:hypothetical protein
MLHKHHMLKRMLINREMMISPNRTEGLMKKLLLLLILLAALALTGCFGDDEATDEPGDDVPGLPAVTPDGSGTDGSDNGDEPGTDGYPEPPGEGGYPAPIPPTPLPPGYPAPIPQPTLDPYPGGFAIFTRPAGVQCEEETATDIDAAVAELEGAGITVQEISLIEMKVCEACGCPTSEHFRALIDPAGTEAALLLGWLHTYQ